jgi:hypothetical protein
MYSDAPYAGTNALCRSCSGGNLRWITLHMAMEVPQPYPLSGAIAVTACGDCGFVGNHSASTDADYAHYYTHNNKHHSRTAALHDLDEAYFTGVLDLIATDGQPDWSTTDILDWGSGALLFSTLAQARGARSASNYDLASPFPDRPYGLVVSTHCIEHVLDFNATFARIRSILADDGLFLIATPDLRGYHDVYWGPYAAFDLEHINHFEIATLGAALTRAGFDIVTAREGERRVTPTLAYPEILFLCRKTSEPAGSGVPASTRAEPLAVLNAYLARSERDFAAMLADMRATVHAYAERGQVISAGLYGVASYAFRLVETLRDDPAIALDWIADSDTRLTGHVLAGHAILDADMVDAWIDTQARKGIRCVAFIAAVNAARIADFLQTRFGERLDVHILPPDCQNRAAPNRAAPNCAA